MSDPQRCQIQQLRDGTLTIDDLADFHEALDELEEYARRAEPEKKDER